MLMQMQIKRVRLVAAKRSEKVSTNWLGLAKV